jgi:hypothetical protein
MAEDKTIGQVHDLYFLDHCVFSFNNKDTENKSKIFNHIHGGLHRTLENKTKKYKFHKTTVLPIC